MLRGLFEGIEHYGPAEQRPGAPTNNIRPDRGCYREYPVDRYEGPDPA